MTSHVIHARIQKRAGGMGHCSHVTYRPVRNQTRKEAFTGVMGVIKRRKRRVLWAYVAVGFHGSFQMSIIGIPSLQLLPYQHTLCIIIYFSSKKINIKRFTDPLSLVLSNIICELMGS